MTNDNFENTILQKFMMQSMAIIQMILTYLSASKIKEASEGIKKANEKAKGV